MQAKAKKLLKPFLKIGLTSLAMYLVITKIDINEIKVIVLQSNIGWLVAAFMMFNLSQVFSSLRLNFFYKSIDILLTNTNNYLLYYKGMFYNLFLPGGLGGDGYKAYLLNKFFKGRLKMLISSMLFDRLSGIAGVFILMIFMLPFMSPDLPYYNLLTISSFGLYPIGLWVAFIVIKKWFPPFTTIFKKVWFYALIVQSLQVLCALFILISIGQYNMWPEYIFLFLLSSIAAAIPVTVGGVGAREMVFFYGSTLFGTDESTALALSLLFFAINTVSSLIGAFTPLPKELRQEAIAAVVTTS